jgi:hypothetical protein
MLTCTSAATTLTDESIVFTAVTASALPMAGSLFRFPNDSSHQPVIHPNVTFL